MFVTLTRRCHFLRLRGVSVAARPRAPVLLLLPQVHSSTSGTHHNTAAGQQRTAVLQLQGHVSDIATAPSSLPSSLRPRLTWPRASSTPPTHPTSGRLQTATPPTTTTLHTHTHTHTKQDQICHRSVELHRARACSRASPLRSFQGRPRLERGPAPPISRKRRPRHLGRPGSYGFDTTLVRTVREAATDWCWSHHASSDFIFHFPLRPSAFAIAQNALDLVDEIESTAEDTVRIRTCGIQSR